MTSIFPGTTYYLLVQAQGLQLPSCVSAHSFCLMPYCHSHALSYW